MRNVIKIGIVAGLISVASVMQSHAQSVMQNLSFSLTAYSNTNGVSARAIRITTRDVIRYFTGTNVANGHIWLISPAGPPITSDNLGVFLRITSGNNFVFDVPSPDTFNIFQDASSSTFRSTSTTTEAINRFSIDFGGFHVELQGFTTWSGRSTTPGGQGSFSSAVNGSGRADLVTQDLAPMKGSISGSAPKIVP